LLILSIDSSQLVGSVTLARQDAQSLRVIDTAEVQGGKFSAQLIPTIQGLLESHSLAKRDIDMIAAASGPGTFTGLRVGLAAVKALAELLNKPVVLVSVLEALAGVDPQNVIAISDAGKGGWYFGHFNSADRTEKHGDLQALKRFVAQYPPATLASNATSGPDIEQPIEKITTPVSELVARLAAQRAARKEFVAIDAIDANYLRSDEGLYRTS
jgi:tRNA threonylcarbamoyl adenosine modification protein YeaZ